VNSQSLKRERPAKGRRLGRPRASDQRVDSRTRLLDAAAHVFAERGYQGATVDQIVASAGLSKGTFYWNFSSKDELFGTLLDERLDKPLRSLMELTRDAPPEQATASDVSAGLERLMQNERQTLLLAHEYWMAAVRDEGQARRYRRRQAALRHLLAEALSSRHEKTGVPLTVPALSLATAFLALGEGLAGAALVDAEAVDPGLYGEVLSLVYDGLEARAERARR
jgi:AcrR family transcriptional regulator